MIRTISTSDDLIDSREVIERIEELESERQDLVDVEDVDVEDWDAENGEELTALKALADEGESSADWLHGETLVRDSYFQTYAEKLADDIGAIDRNASWPVNCIDWEQAARELQQDYSSVDFDGVTYWIRA